MYFSKTTHHSGYMKVRFKHFAITQVFSSLDDDLDYIYGYAAGRCLSILYQMTQSVLALSLDLVVQDKVSSHSEEEKENRQHTQVHGKLCILHVPQLQDLPRLLELASSA